MPCTCSTEYDSVTGENHHDVCDWCQTGCTCTQEHNEEMCEACKQDYDEWEADQDSDRCYCEYSYDRDGRYLDWECEACAATHTPPPSPPPPAPWAVEKAHIGFLIDKMMYAPTQEARIATAAEIYRYVQTIGPFLLKFPRFYDVTYAKLKEFRADSRTESIADVLNAADVFLAGLKPAADSRGDE